MTVPPQPATPPAGGGRGGSLAGKVGGPRNLALLGAGLTVAAVALFSSMRSKSAGGSTTLMSSGDFDSSPYDMWNAWQEEYEDLQEQVNSQGGGTTTATAPPKSTLPAPVKKPPIPKPAPKPPPPKPKPKPKPHPKPKPKPKPKRPHNKWTNTVGSILDRR
jgi:outer membrane biosynthesis protein TonB